MSGVIDIRCALRIHDSKHAKYGSHDVVVGHDLVAGLRDGALVEVISEHLIVQEPSLDLSSSSSDERRSPLILRVSHIAKEKDVKLSILAGIANVFSLKQGYELVLRVTTEEEAAVQYAEIVIKDQYFNPVDMWRMEQSLLGSCLYTTKQITFLSMRVTVQELLTKEGVKTTSGCVTANTKFVFRSRSAKFCILLQLSQEMWYFSRDGEMYFEKAIHFLRVLFDKWRQHETSHKISIVLFSRIFWSSPDNQAAGQVHAWGPEPPEFALKIGAIKDIPVIRKHPLSNDMYEDFYKVLTTKDSAFDCDQVIRALKEAFRQFPNSVGWDAKWRSVEGGQRTNSTAFRGNILEALNLALVDFDKPSVDIDLRHTGQGIIVVSAGSGFFEVDSRLEHITKQKVLDNGVGVDLVFLGQPPLHVVPLFKGFNVPSKLAITDTVFKTPHWLYTSFFHGEGNSLGGQACRLPGLPDPEDYEADFVLGVQELSQPPPGASLLQWMDDHDASVFRPRNSQERADGAGRRRRKGLRKRRDDFNPFTPAGPDRTRDISSTNRRRWAHLFHDSIYDIIAKTQYAYAPNWMSLCKPASLPLTTDYFPPQGVLDQHYLESPSMVSCLHASETFPDVRELLVELVSQRLAHGFQLVVPLDSAPSSSLFSKLQYLLAMGHVYHRLTVVGPNIEIKRYSLDPRHDKKADLQYPSEHLEDEGGVGGVGGSAPRARSATVAGIVTRQVYAYGYQVSSEAGSTFYPPWARKSIEFKASKFNPHFWPTLDSMICNETEDLRRPLHYWSLAFFIPPVYPDTPAVASLATRAFKSFMSAINRMLKRLSKDVVDVELPEEIVHAIDSKGAKPDPHPRMKALERPSISMPHLPIPTMSALLSAEPARADPSVAISPPRSPSMSTKHASESFPPAMKTVKARAGRSDVKPARHEWMVIRHSSKYSPQSFFHVEMRALVITGEVLSDFITGFERKAKACGVVLLSCPTNVINKRVKKYSPFVPGISVKFTPQDSSKEERLRERDSILELFGFVRNAHDPPDRVGTEYIHFSGTLFCRVVDYQVICYQNLLVSKPLQEVGLQLLHLLGDYCEIPAGTRPHVHAEFSSKLEKLYSEGLQHSKSSD